MRIFTAMKILLEVKGFVLIGFLMSLFNYSSGQTYYANGDAKSVGGDCYQLTNSTNWQNGSVWYASKIDLQSDFDLEFYLNFGSSDYGADGIMFVLQDRGNQAIGQSGGGLGYEGFSPSLGVEFDNFQNTAIGDPSYDHIAVFQDGNISHSNGQALHAPVPSRTNSGNVEDGQDHLIRVKWTSSTQALEVYFDCVKRISLQYDIQKLIFNDERYVYWGFTAATGSLNNKQTACLRKDILVKDTVPICKGDAVPINSRKSEDDVYKWWPNVDLSDATIKNPICSSIVQRTYYVEYTDLCGDKLIDTVEVVIHQPFTMDEAQDSFLCDLRSYELDLRVKYDSILWNDGLKLQRRFLTQPGYYKFRAWQGVCWDDDSLTITTDITPQLSIEGDSFFCEGDTSILQLLIEPSSAVFQWQNGSTDSFYTSTETETVFVEASNRCGDNQASYSTREIIIPEIEIIGDSIFCPDDSAVLFASNYEPYLPKWSNGFSGIMQSVGPGSYQVRIEDQHCFDEDNFEVEFRPLPQIAVDPFIKHCEFEALTLQTDSQDLVSYLWSNSSKKHWADYSDYSGNHWAKAYNACGTDSVNFFLERPYCTCDIWTPNAFTPNFDDRNEVFRFIPNCNKMLSFSYVIYNRWGEQIFDANSIDQAWDGTFNEQPCPTGVYFWIVNYSGIEGRSAVRKTQDGIIHLIR